MVLAMKVRNLNKPDSLRALVAETRMVQTRPHGVKVAEAGEATVYTATSGDTYWWDGDSVADYGQRITDAQQKIAQATTDLADAEAGLDAAGDRIKAVEDATTAEAIGSTAANQINTRRLIVGRDAVIAGTLDVKQLNVTDELAAQVVNAMSAQTKNLVVTEDAVLNRATVVQSLVTPELVAQRIDVKQLGAKLITAGALQTDTAATTGVKIDNSGYRAYDSAGNLAVSLDGKQNLMIGSFQTKVADKTGVRITAKGSLSAIDWYSGNAGTSGQGTLNGAHGFTFFESPGSLGSTNFTIGAQDGVRAIAASDPTMVFRPINKSISFSGKFDNVGSAFQAGQITTGSVPAGGYVDSTVTFDTAMPSGVRPVILISPVSAARTELAYVITEDSTTGFKVRVVNKSGNSTSALWIKWVAFSTTPT